jgi:hypothetical protein
MIAGEMPDGSRARRVELVAAALRLRAMGCDTPTADFCDTTHCAWFIGRGLASAGLARGSPWSRARPCVPRDEEWDGQSSPPRGDRPGPLDAHCGGQAALRVRRVGRGDRRAPACPLHAGAPPPPWTRFWPDDALQRAFGARVTRIDTTVEDGVHRLLVASGGTTRRLLYDDAHRALASVLGWDAVPSPPGRVTARPPGSAPRASAQGTASALCLNGGAARSAAARARGATATISAGSRPPPRPGLRGTE